MNTELLKLIQPELTEQQIREVCREKKEDLGFDIEKAIFPTNPLDILEPKISLDDAIQLVEKWDGVRASVRGSVSGSVWGSVWCSVWGSVWYSVLDSAWDSASGRVWDRVWGSVSDSVYAYVSSIFTEVTDWKDIDHEPGVNPYQSAIDLWEAGYLPTFDGDVWRLHTGADARIVWEGAFNNGEKT